MPEIPGSRLPGNVDHVDALHVGARLGEFEVVGLLGVGGFGMVYQAFDHSLLRFVAIKEYMPTALAGRANGRTVAVRSTSDESSFKVGLASFVDEARLLAQFDHPSLVKVFRFWEANQTAYMVMPLYAGMTLKEARTHMRVPPSEEWLRKIIWSVCSALRVLHNGKTLHRDISPDNIFLQDQGPPVLLDLGAARFAIGDRERRHTAVLKVNYAPIEQYAETDSELKPGPWSDVYSLAAVVYGCICNDAPLPSTLRSIRDRMVPFPRVARTVRKQFGVEYSTPFVEAITKALSLQPRDRHWTVDAFLDQMGLRSAPQNLDKFAFRAELADNWVNQITDTSSGSAVDLSAASAPASGPAVASPISSAAAVPSAAVASAAPAPAKVNDAWAASPLPLPSPSVPVDSARRRAKERVEAAVAESAESEFQDTVVRTPDFEDTRDGPYPAALAAAAAARNGHTSGKSRHGAAGKPGSKKGPPSSRKSSGKRSGVPRALWLSAALVVLVGGASAWYMSSVSAPVAEAQPQPAFVPTPDEEILTELADPPKEDLAAASEHQHAASAASEPASMVPVIAAPKEQKPRPAPVRKPVEHPVVEPPPVVVTQAPPVVPVPVPASRPEPPKRVNPEDTCANAGFLAKPMCVHNECQKPGMLSHPVCVENKRKRDEERRQRQNYSQ